MAGIQRMDDGGELAPSHQSGIVDEFFSKGKIAVVTRGWSFQRISPGIHCVDEVKAQPAANKFHVIVAQFDVPSSRLVVTDQTELTGYSIRCYVTSIRNDDQLRQHLIVRLKLEASSCPE